MSGLYNLVLGDGHEPDREGILLAILGNPNPGRIRDAWVEKGPDGEPLITIYTRNGGGNRKCYHDDDYDSDCTGCIGTDFETRRGCVRAADDEFDCTYRTYWFTTPPEYRDALAEIAGEPVNMSDRWRAVIAAMGDN